MSAPSKIAAPTSRWPLFDHRAAILKACPGLEELFLAADVALQGRGCRGCVKNAWHRRISKALAKAAATGHDLRMLEPLLGPGFLPEKAGGQAAKTLKRRMEPSPGLDWYRERLGKAVISLGNGYYRGSPEVYSVIYALGEMKKRADWEYPELAEALEKVSRQFFAPAEGPPDLMALFDLLQGRLGRSQLV